MESLPSRPTAREVVAEHLRRQILAGELKPAERLLIPEIAARMGVSQTPTRAALQQLEAEGLVSSSAFRGSRVAELDPDEAEEIYAMRSALERLAARYGTLGIDAAGIAELERLLALLGEAAAAQDVDGFLELDREFHRVHYLASGRTRLWERIIALRYAAERYTRLTYETLPGEMTDGIARHAQLLDCIRARDTTGAETWISDTMTRVAATVRRMLDSPTQQAQPQPQPGSSSISTRSG